MEEETDNMSITKRVAIVGNYLPRRCGIATFTHDLHAALASASPDVDVSVVAMTNPNAHYDYPTAVRYEIHDDQVADYIDAATALNKSKTDVVSLQHEYGIFGGESGGFILELLGRLRMPVVTTLHTILPNPSRSQKAVMDQIIAASSRLVVMSEKGHEFLRSVHDVPASNIDVIPHGIPDFPLRDPEFAKSKFGFSGKTVVLTFGLLSPGKGIETVIDAMPGILRSCPNAVYVVLGATHPHLVEQHGEMYREGLLARAKTLGIQNSVFFIDKFVDQPTLLDYISMCDVYVTPYLNEAQMTSGTLAYSFGLGKAVVSTPYWHAKELLAEGRGIIVPFNDAHSMSVEIAGLLTDQRRRDLIGQRAYKTSRLMTWQQTAEKYSASFEEARNADRKLILLPEDSRSIGKTKSGSARELRTDHFMSMCDDVGMLQHAVFSVADRAHGYCVDDNARALLLSTKLTRSGEQNLPDVMTARFASFIQNAWNPDNKRFRNFMSYDRRWLEDVGSEDSHGRTLWALGECARYDSQLSRRQWAADLFRTALPVVNDFSSPRAWAFTLLGLNAYCDGETVGFESQLRDQLAAKLVSMLSMTETAEWVWFEDLLAYDNARISQSLIQAGAATKNATLTEGGLRSLRWLIKLQSAPSGYFRPVGTTSFGVQRRKPGAFDQQPVEAAAMISACLSAYSYNAETEWSDAAMQAFDWFHGANDLQVEMINPTTGGCSDGLHPDRPNANEGAESVLSYLLSLVEMRSYERLMSSDRIKISGKVARRAEQRLNIQRIPTGGPIVSTPVLKSAEPIPSTGSIQGRR